MEYGIQRRSIYLIPPSKTDWSWFYEQMDREENWSVFGWPGPARVPMMRAVRLERVVVGMLYRVIDRTRIGFVVMFPPTGEFDFWEFAYAIPCPDDRDAFSALSATDAMAHYMFDHLRVEAMGWRTREDNRAADAVIRRLGYRSFGAWAIGGHQYTFYRLDQEGWARRKRTLEAGEARRPSGLGAVFKTLPEPPFDPLPLSSSSTPVPEPESAGPAALPDAAAEESD